MGALGTFVSAQLDGDAKDEKKAAAQHEFAAGHAKRGVETATEDMKDARDLMKKAIDFYREYATAQSQASSAALHRS